MNGWISKQTRPPTREDADAQNCVLVWHVFQGVMVTGWHQVEHNEFITHWQHTPSGPET